MTSSQIQEGRNTFWWRFDDHIFEMTRSALMDHWFSLWPPEGDVAQRRHLFLLPIITIHWAPPPAASCCILTDVWVDRNPWREQEARKDPNSSRERLSNSSWTLLKQGTCPAQPSLSSYSSEGSVTWALPVLPAQEPAAFPVLSHAPASYPSAWDGFCPE